MQQNIILCVYNEAHVEGSWPPSTTSATWFTEPSPGLPTWLQGTHLCITPFHFLLKLITKLSPIPLHFLFSDHNQIGKVLKQISRNIFIYRSPDKSNLNEWSQVFGVSLSDKDRVTVYWQYLRTISIRHQAWNTFGGGTDITSAAQHPLHSWIVAGSDLMVEKQLHWIFSP